jgi:hypothetical protein
VSAEPAVQAARATPEVTEEQAAPAARAPAARAAVALVVLQALALPEARAATVRVAAAAAAAAAPMEGRMVALVVMAQPGLAATIPAAQVAARSDLPHLLERSAAVAVVPLPAQERHLLAALVALQRFGLRLQAALLRGLVAAAAARTARRLPTMALSAA